MPIGIYKRTKFHSQQIRDGMKLKRKSDGVSDCVDWGGGRHRCIDCGNEHGKYERGRKRCRKCYFKFSTGSNNPHWKGGRKKCNVCQRLLTHESKKTKICRSCYTGSRNHMWRGGLSNFPYPFPFNNKLRELIRIRDNRECQLCGVPESALNRKICVHHIDYRKDNLGHHNLISLCNSCNVKVNTNRNYWRKHFK